MSRRVALIAGGGTAGHLLPALAIGEALVAAGTERGAIEFIGSERGQDAAMLEGRGFPSTLLPGRGIVRSFSPSAITQNIGALIGLGVATFRALAIVAMRRPSVVVAVGGYASVPASVAGVLFGVPLVLVNVDAVPGAANRLFGRLAAASAVGWPNTELPRAVVTGTPVRDEIAAVARTEASRHDARRDLGLDSELPLVVVFGGSLGARRINEAMDEVALRWRDRTDCQVLHITGQRDWPRYESQPPSGGALRILRVPYEQRMALVYAAADVVVCRSGAMTVAELSLVGLPAVLVPLPGAPGDHQTANASQLSDHGAAVLLADRECTGATLDRIVGELLADPDRRAAMEAAGRAQGHRDAAAAGARVVLANARPGKGER